MDRLLYVGVTHKTAATAVRERLAAGPERAAALLKRLRSIVEECVVLSTCGRFELYMVVPPARQGEWPNILASVLNQPAPALANLLHARRGGDAARHALSVAAGLESRVLGEDQVLSQTRRAFALACEHGACGPVLSTLFRTAIHAGKRVRAETDINRAHRSIAHLAVREVLSMGGTGIQSSTGTQGGTGVPPVRGEQFIRAPSHMSSNRPLVVVIGTGAMGQEVAACLSRRGGCRLHVVGRHPKRISGLAERVGGCGHSLDDLAALIRRADAVIACAMVSRPLIVPMMLHGRSPQDHPLLLVDLGVPRNIDSACGSVIGVRLLDIEALTPYCFTRVGSINQGGTGVPPVADGQDARTPLDARTIRATDLCDPLKQADRIIAEELSRFETWLRGRAAAPAIASLLRRADVPDRGRRRALRRALHARVVRLKREAVA